MTVLADLNSRNWPAGSNTAGPADIPQGLTRLRATFTRENWPAGTNIVTVRIEISFDGGATWPEFAEASWNGGTRINRLGNTVTEEMIERDIKEPTNPNRMARGILTRTTGLRTGITVE